MLSRSRTLIVFALLISAVPAFARPVRARHLPGGIAELPASMESTRSLLQEAIDCGLKGDVFKVEDASDLSQIFKSGAYFLIRDFVPSGRCHSVHWTFLVDPDLRQDLRQRLAAGDQIAIFSPSVFHVDGTAFKVDAIAVQPGDSEIESLFARQINRERSVFIITPSMSRSIFVHEYQHFEDYEAEIPEKIKDSAIEAGIPEQAVPILLHFVMETRAYGRQVQFLESSSRAHEYALHPDGEVARYAGPRMREAHVFDLQQNFNENYTSVIAEGLQNLKGEDPDRYQSFVLFLRQQLRPSDVRALNLGKALPELLANCETQLVP